MITHGYILYRISQLRVDLKVAEGNYRAATKVFKRFTDDLIGELYAKEITDVGTKGKVCKKEKKSGILQRQSA